jgi:hypothetical protein
MPFIQYNNPGSITLDHGALTGLTDNDHPQYAPSTDWTPPPFYRSDADNVGIRKGRYHKGGERIFGHYQDLAGMASYWDVSANFTVDIDATYSAGSTSGILGGDVASSWYSFWMVDSDEILILPMIRVDALDYDTSNAGKTTINPAAHSDGTTAENGFLTANDQWNNYRLLLIAGLEDSNHGREFTIEDTVTGTPDEIIIDGDQTSYISATNWLLLIPPSSTDCCYLGTMFYNSSGQLDGFISPEAFEIQWTAEKTVAGVKNTTAGNTDLNAAVSPTTIRANLMLYGNSDSTAAASIRVSIYSGSSGTNLVAEPRIQPGVTEVAWVYLQIYYDHSFSVAAQIRNKFEMRSSSAWVAAIVGNFGIRGFKE